MSLNFTYLRKKILTVFIAILICAIADSAPAIHNYTAKDGISDMSPTCLLQDSDSLLWIGTWTGLNVFDGHRFNILRPSLTDPNSLSSVVIKKLQESSDGYIWIATSYGVDRMNKATFKTTHYLLGYEGRLTVDNDSFSVAAAEDGTVFSSAYMWGLAVYDPETDRMAPVNIAGINTTGIKDMVCVGNLLYILNRDGSVCSVSYKASNGGVEAYMNEKIYEPGEVSLIFTDGESIGFVKNDCIVINDGNSSYTIALAESCPVNSACFSNDGNMVYVSFNNSTTVSASVVNGGWKEEQRLNGKRVMCLLSGSQDILWAGAKDGGLYALYDDSSHMEKTLVHDIFGDRVSAVSCFLELPDAGLLVGTEGNGIARIGKGQTRIIDEVNGLSSNTVYSMASFENGALIGHSGEGVSLLLENRIENLYDESSGSLRDVYSIAYDKNQDCWWMGTYDNGLFKVKISSGTGKHRISFCQQWKYTPSDENTIPGNFVSTVLVMPSGRIMAGTVTAGICVLDPSTGAITRYNSGELNHSSNIKKRESYLDSDGVLSGLLDSHSRMWIGTGGGLNLVTENNDGSLSFRSWSLQDGLQDYSVHGIAEDRNGDIWVSTNNGITKISSSGAVTLVFSDDDDLQSREFTNGSAMTSSSGIIFFGGVSGFNWFDPSKVSSRSYHPKVVIEDLLVRQTPMKVPESGEPLVLSHQENFFTFRFAALDFIENYKCEYDYFLDGFDKEWNKPGTRGEAVYTNVPPGRYTFRVRCTNGDKVESPCETDLLILIRKPWWNTWWAYLLYIFLGFGVIMVVWEYSQKRTEQKHELEKEALENEMQKEQYEAKLTFFTNIAHEFGSPLTLISSASDRIVHTSVPDSRTKGYLNIITSNAERMRRLISELMDFRKVDSGSYNLVYSSFDISSMLRSVVDNFHELGERKNVSVSIDAPDKFLVISDCNAMDKIFSNLISNAYKYTPDNGWIEVCLSDDDKKIHLNVRNSGKGIKKEDIDSVFDRFRILDSMEKQAVEGTVSRNGIGLALTKSLVETLGGTISVISEEGLWTEFRLALPSLHEVEGTDQASVAMDMPNQQEQIPFIHETETSVKEHDHIPDAPEVLVVDDEAGIRYMVGDILSDKCNVMYASDGLEALDVLKNCRPDLMIVDINMPRMNGIELVRRIRGNEITKVLPVIFLTFSSDVDNELEANRLGCEAFIAKPFNPRQLNSVVERVLNGRKALRSYYNSALSNTELYNSEEITSSQKEFIVKLTRFVEDNLQNGNLSQDEVASAMCVSKSELYLKVKEITKMPPVDFIRTIKLESAARLLRTKEMSVQEVLFASGFNNKSYFYREFAKKYGKTPLEYREAMNPEKV